MKKLILTGRRISLRLLTLSDATSISKNMNNPEVTRYTGWKYPFTRQDATRIIKKYQKGMRRGTGYAFGIEEKGRNAIIGMVDFVLLDKQRMPALEFWLGKDFWRRGYSEEAVRLMINFGFKRLKLRRIYSAAFQRNKSSNGLLLKVGFKEYTRRFAELKRRRIKQVRYVMYR